jgi:hypothetical protein
MAAGEALVSVGHPLIGRLQWKDDLASWGADSPIVWNGLAPVKVLLLSSTNTLGDFLTTIPPLRTTRRRQS